MATINVRALILFLGMALVAAVVLVAAQTQGSGFAQLVLVQMGSVVFGAGLTVFVLQLTATVAPK